MDQSPTPDDHQHQQTSRPQVSPPVDESGGKQQSPEETRQELKDAIEGSNEVLVSATTTLSLFPDTIIVDRAKLTVIRRTFLRSAEVMSIRIEDILNVTATVGPFLGTVKVVSRVLNAEKPYSVGKFWRDDATRLKRITQGYVIALQRNIDCSALPLRELSKMLDELGQDDHVL